MELREHRSSFLVYVTLRLAVVAMAVLQFWNGNYENVILCILSLMLLGDPQRHAADFSGGTAPGPGDLHPAVHLAAEILGEIGEFYLASRSGTRPCTRSTDFSARPSASPW